MWRVAKTHVSNVMVNSTSTNLSKKALSGMDFTLDHVQTDWMLDVPILLVDFLS